jgi:capsular polysaccharide transport system permease protein
VGGAGHGPAEAPGGPDTPSAQPSDPAPAQAPARPAGSATARPTPDRAALAEQRASEIVRIQRDIARRRRRAVLLLVHLAVFVLLPTVAAGWYFARVATPMYATRSEFVIQQAEAAGAGGLGGLFQGTSMATQQDSMTVQAYVASRAALLRLDADHGFTGRFSDPSIDPIQRLPPDATAEDAYALYQDHVKSAYDPTEGIVKMEVIAPEPRDLPNLLRGAHRLRR